MNELTVEMVDALVAVDRVVRRLGPALHAFAASMLVADGDPVDDAFGLVEDSLARLLEHQGLDVVIAQRAAYDVLTSVLLSKND